MYVLRRAFFKSEIEITPPNLPVCRQAGSLEKSRGKIPLFSKEGLGEFNCYASLRSTRAKDIPQAFKEGLNRSRKKIWSIIRNRQIRNLKFFRQYGVGPYILDFYCPQKKLALERDGGQHNLPKNTQDDRMRSLNLQSLGIKVLRFWNNDVLQNPESVYQKILQEIKP